MIIDIIIILVVIVAIVLIVALFTAKKYTVAREAIINKPKQTVFDYIKLNKNQRNYNKWLLRDPDTRFAYKGAEDGKPGAILAYESNQRETGKGELEIKKLDEGKRMDFELRFLSPMVFTSSGYFATEAVTSGQTKTKWVFNGGMNWPRNIMLLFMNMDKLLGTTMEESLATLKTILEG